MAYTAQQALQKISQLDAAKAKVSDIRAILNEVDVTTNAQTMLLYSGGVGDSLPDGKLEYSAENIAKSISNQSGVVTGSTDTRTIKTIFDTQISKLLSNDPASSISVEFRNKFAAVLKNDPVYLGRSIDQVLTGRDSSGAYIGDGLWDDASVNLVKQHNGNFEIIAPNAPDASTLNYREIPALLEKTGNPAQKINGIDLQTWKGTRDAEIVSQTAKNILNGMTPTQASAAAKVSADQDIKDLVRKTSAATLANSNIGKDATGKVHIDTNGDLGKKLGLAPKDIPGTVPSEKVSSLPNVKLDANDLSKLAKYGDFINKAGFVGDVLGTAVAIGQAHKAYAEKNYVAAGEIMASHAGGLLGGVVGGEIGVAAGGALLAGLLLIPGVNVGVIGGMAIVGAGGLVGGYLGGTVGEKYFNDLYNDIANVGLIPSLNSLRDDYGWALKNPGALLDGLFPDGLKGLLPDWMSPPANQFGQAPGVASPLVLDLDGDGVEVTRLGLGTGASNVYFDMDNDGFAERTGWVTGGDGLLALDKNNNGKIDSQAELFGNTATAADGFTNLKTLDSNQDNKITSADAQWSKLKVWIDADKDGVTDAGELKSMADLKITQINLNPAVQTGLYKEENLVSHTSTFVMNGQTRAIEDIWFRNDDRDTKFTGDVTLDTRTLFLPTLKGFGNVKDLHIAMSQNSGLLQSVMDFVKNWSPAKLAQPAALNAEIESILFKWAGVDTVSPTSLGGTVNAQYLRFMEKFTGLTHDQAFISSLSGRPGPSRAINQSFTTLFDTLKAHLILQADGDSFFEHGSATYSLGSADLTAGTVSAAAVAKMATQAAILTSSAAKTAYWQAVAEVYLQSKPVAQFTVAEISLLNNAIKATSPELSWESTTQIVLNKYTVVSAQGTEFSEYLSGSERGDYFSGLGGDDVIYGQGGDDYVNGGNGKDQVFGGAGNDRLDGEGGDDVLAGGAGDDLVYGGDGNDTYQYDSGKDVFTDYGGTDSISMNGTLTAANITLQRVPANLQDLNILVNGQLSITVQNHYYNTNAIERLNFSNGTNIDLTQFKDILGTESANTLNGLDKALLLDDVIYGYGGNDTLNGLKGNDVLMGGSGNDKYIYSTGADQGKDVIRDDEGAADSIALGAGYTSANIILERIGQYDLAIKSGAQTLIVIEGQFMSSRNIETLVYGNGATLNLLTYNHTVNGSAANDTIYGTSYGAAGDKLNGLGGNDIMYAGEGDDTLTGGDGNDTLHGENGNDTLTGNAGNDYLYGGYGNDTYIYDGGIDTIQENGGTDTVTITNSAITAANMTLVRPAGSPGDLQVMLNGTLAFTISGQFYQEYGVETIKFANGSTFSLSSVQYTTEGGAGNDALYGIGSGGNPNDILKGNAGNDTVYAYGGNDSLTGGTGNDYLDGGEGNDTYYYAAGDGLDTIYDQNGTDTIQLSAGFVKTDLAWQRDGMTSDVMLLLKGVAVMKLQYYFGQNYQIENVKFSDGSSQSLINLQFTTNGTENADSISGIQYGALPDDIINAKGGNDSIYAYDGHDKITGGSGNDYIDGGQGNDTYYYNAGDGLDTILDQSGGADIIQMGAGFIKSDMTYQVSGQDLKVFFKGVQTFLLQSQLTGDAIETIKFSDGSVFALGGLASVVTGTSASDSLQGNNNTSDTLQGLAGDDYLYGYAGADTLDGGAGSDQLYGGAGDDAYLLVAGSGIDYISDESGANDTLKFGTGITAANIRFAREGGNLDIYYSATDKLSITGQFYDDAYGTDYTYEVEKLVLADGTTFNLTGSLTYKGTAGADSVSGTKLTDTLQALAGDDYLYGYAGTDTLDGGAGSDQLYGGAGDDTYLFSTGSGIDYISDESGANDTLKFGTGITSANIRFERESNNLNIYYGTSDKINITGQFYDETYGTDYTYEVEKIVLADGTIFNLTGSLTYKGTAETDSLSGTKVADSLLGLAGDDYLNSYAGNDTLDGGAGNDQLYGGAGDDTYLFVAGSGVDYIVDESGASDTLKFGAGITAANIRFERESSNLNIYYSATDKLSITGQFYDESYGTDYTYEIEKLILADGTTFNLTGSLTYKGTADVDSLSGTKLADILQGLASDDYLYGYAGNDTLDGGAGTDQMSGGVGNDIYVVDIATDALYEYQDEGTDTVQSAVTWTLGDNFENLQLTGTAAINGTGNAFANSLAGNSAANTLKGNDTLSGGAGNDILYGDNGLDTLIADAGLDTLYGGADKDTFKFSTATLDGQIDRIKDFSLAQGDVLNVKDILVGYDPLTKVITNYIEMTTSGANTIMKVDRDGTGTAYTWTQIAQLDNVTGLTDEAGLVTQGRLVAV